MAGLVGKFKDMWKQPAEDEVEYDDYYENQDDGYYESSEDDKKAASKEPASAPSNGGRSGNKVVNIHQTPNLQVVLFKPERFGEETRDIANELLKMNTVLLNLENTNKDMSRRIIDFLSGAAYANDGKITRVATNTYMITPSNVDITGNDLLDELESNGIYF